MKQGTQSIWNVKSPHLKVLGWGWRASSGYFFFFYFRGLRFDFQWLRTISNFCLRGSDALSGLSVDQVHTWCTDMHADTRTRKIGKLIRKCLEVGPRRLLSWYSDCHVNTKTWDRAQESCNKSGNSGVSPENSRAREVETGRSWGLLDSQWRTASSPQVYERPYLRKQNSRLLQLQNEQESDLWPLLACAQSVLLPNRTDTFVAGIQPESSHVSSFVKCKFSDALCPTKYH